MPFQGSNGRHINGPPVPLMTERNPVTAPRPPSVSGASFESFLPAGVRKEEILAKATQAETTRESDPFGIDGATSAPAKAAGTIAARKTQSPARKRASSVVTRAAPTTPASTKLARQRYAGVNIQAEEVHKRRCKQDAANADQADQESNRQSEADQGESRGHRDGAAGQGAGIVMSTECCRHGPGMPCVWKWHHTSGRDSPWAAAPAPAGRSDST